MINMTTLGKSNEVSIDDYTIDRNCLVGDK